MNELAYEKQTFYLEVCSLVKDYPLPDGGKTRGLSLESLCVCRGEMLVLEGPSGSGKTTFLHLLAGLYAPTAGKILLEGRRINAYAKDIDLWRARNIGYIFQSMNLLPDFSILENILIAAEISGLDRKKSELKALSLLERLGLSRKFNQHPSRLSLGEQQRTAIARAVIHTPALILADEPTAALDEENSVLAINCLTELCIESGSTLILSTHDESVKKNFNRIVTLKKGDTNPVSSHGVKS